MKSVSEDLLGITKFASLCSASGWCLLRSRLPFREKSQEHVFIVTAPFFQLRGPLRMQESAIAIEHEEVGVSWNLRIGLQEFLISIFVAVVHFHNQVVLL